MYTVFDKTKNEIIHQNPAPLSQNLKGKDIYFLYDSDKHFTIKTNGALPEHYDVVSGIIVEWDLQKKYDNGLNVCSDFEKVVNNKIIQKTDFELSKESLINLDEYKERKKSEIDSVYADRFNQELENIVAVNNPSLKTKKNSKKLDVDSLDTPEKIKDYNKDSGW